MLIRPLTLLTLSLCLACAAVHSADAEPSKLSVEAIGLRVARPNALKERVLWPAGSTLSLLVSSSASELIHFSAVDSTIAKFVDDKGTDLQTRLKDSGNEPLSPAGFGYTPKIDKDAKSCLIEVSAPGLPVKGAARIQLAGTITMLCATQKKETVVSNVPMREGAKISGPNNLELQIEESNSSPLKGETKPTQILLRALRELDDLAEIKFFRPDGSEIKAVRTSTSTLSVQGDVKVDWTYRFEEHVDTATVKLYTWSDIEKRRVKLDLTIDIGL